MFTRRLRKKGLGAKVGASNLTSGLANTSADLAGLLEVDVPALGLASLVLQGEGEDAVALLDGVLALILGGGEDGVDGVEGHRGGKLVCL